MRGCTAVVLRSGLAAIHNWDSLVANSCSRCRLQYAWWTNAACSVVLTVTKARWGTLKVVLNVLQKGSTKDLARAKTNDPTFAVGDMSPVKANKHGVVATSPTHGALLHAHRRTAATCSQTSPQTQLFIQCMQHSACSLQCSCPTITRMPHTCPGCAHSPFVQSSQVHLHFSLQPHEQHRSEG